MNHAVVIDRGSDILFALRWEHPNDVREHRITSISHAQELLSAFAHDRPESTTTAIARTLTTFRSLRLSLSGYHGNDLDAIRALNVLLLSADAIRRGTVRYSHATLAVAVESLRSARAIPYAASEFSPSVRQFPLGELADQLLEDCNGLRLDPYLLIRHASGTLFQEAHNCLEATPQRMLFVSLHAAPPAAKKTAKRDTRYTPATLARFLAESAINEFTKLNPRATVIDILDPACGSGVFLVEATRASRKLVSMQLRGVDRSPASAIIADFAARQAARSRTDELSVTVDVKKADSLAERDWGTPDIILMNPPFLPWRIIDSTTKASIRATLGPLYFGQSDTAIAFVARAIKELKPGAVLGTVIPAAFLDSRAARRLRKAIAEDDSLSVRLIGRFRGFTYFADAAVEPGFLLISRAKHNGSGVLTATAESGCEDRAIRAIRTFGAANELPGNGYAITRQPYSILESPDWTPRSPHATAIVDRWRSNGMRRLTELFDVRLGIRAGAKRVFIISEEELRRTTAKETQYFRPVADEIRNGHVVEGKSVFYPYRQGTLLLRSEYELGREVPWFYEARLRPNREMLSSRKSLRSRQWWELVEPRPTWMDDGIPRILSPAFGCCGAFANDEQARFAVVQGSAWFWRSGSEEAKVRLAYLALFNSYEFEALLDLLCPRVAGGQYQLYKADLHSVPIPDLSQVSPVLMRQLAHEGKQIAEGKAIDPLSVSDIVLEAYGVDREEFHSHFARGRLGALHDEFNLLSSQWKIVTRLWSNVTKIANQSSYRRIIAMGDPAVSWILRDLAEQGPNHWFLALANITGESPIEGVVSGDMIGVTKAWLKWGLTKGYLCN